MGLEMEDGEEEGDWDAATKDGEVEGWLLSNK